MNKENNPAPRCPYCGAEIRLEDNEDVLFGFEGEEKLYWYQCMTPSCMVNSPVRRTETGAYKAAMARWQEPNRVLTLDEVHERELENIAICCETKETLAWLGKFVIPNWRNCNIEILEALNISGYFAQQDGITVVYTKFPSDEKYGKTWRCWMRKPTPEEMQETPWEER